MALSNGAFNPIGSIAPHLVVMRKMRKIPEILAELVETIEQEALQRITARLHKARSRAEPAKPKRQRVFSGRRETSAIETLKAAVLDYVKKNPGQRMIEIAPALGIESKMLQLPMKKLVKDKAVKAKGVKTNTTYE